MHGWMAGAFFLPYKKTNCRKGDLVTRVKAGVNINMSAVYIGTLV